MNDPSLKTILDQVARGELPVAEALQQLRHRPLSHLGFARVDDDRARRCGFPEVIFAAGKEPQQVAGIFAHVAETHGRVLATRADTAAFAAVAEVVPDARYHEAARAITWQQEEPEKTGQVLVLTAGTSDIPVAEEARVTAEMLGARTTTHFDVGVAGIHRLLELEEDLRAARALVVAAGMEGALPSVVAGLVQQPVIAVPTSVGYGASFGGITALLAMLNSCATGVSVVNIDNGFGAGYLAAMINRGAS